MQSNHFYLPENPSIRINDSLSCNRFSSVILYCSILTELNNYGFNRWKHSVRGTFLRTVNGENHNKQSSLPFGSCSYQDAGEYECIAWSEHAGVIFYANETVSLSVNRECHQVIFILLKKRDILMKYFSLSKAYRP